jgi:nucleotide-binding universal stress UspA family protein
VPASVSDELSHATDRNGGRGCCPELVEHPLVVQEGDPVQVIRRAAARLDADLIIGTRGHTGPKRVLLGSVADEPLRSLECDVLAAASIA